MIVAVSAGQYSSNKGADILRQHHKYLNFGLLGLCTLVKHDYGKEIVMIQGDYYPCHIVINRILKIVPLHKIDLLLLSIPSYFSLPWSRDFCNEIYKFSDIKIVVGGRWVINNDISWLQSKLPPVHRIIDGYGEDHIGEILDIDKVTGTISNRKLFKQLDYSILADYKDYHPSLEVSRGCGAGCAFCLDANSRKTPNKEVCDILLEIDSILQWYEDLQIYFESPHFLFENEWTNSLCSELSRSRVKWRCTTRIDTAPLERLDELFQSGLSILDIGLESASITQLQRMNKARNPRLYLKKADELLRKCNNVGIKVKLNILLFAGETNKTIDETLRWLTSRRDIIHGVSVSSLIYYRNTANPDYFTKLGAILTSPNGIEEKGFSYMDLSDEIRYTDVSEISHCITSKVMNIDDYYYLKSFSYFSPKYTYHDFKQDVVRIEKSSLPFHIDGMLA